MIVLLHCALFAFMTGIVSGVIFTAVWTISRRSQL